MQIAYPHLECGRSLHIMPTNYFYILVRINDSKEGERPTDSGGEELQTQWATRVQRQQSQQRKV